MAVSFSEWVIVLADGLMWHKEVVRVGEEAGSILASSNHSNTKPNFCVLQYYFPRSFPNSSAFEGSLMYSVLVFASGSLGMVMVLLLASYITQTCSAAKPG